MLRTDHKCYENIYRNLVGGWPTPPKNMSQLGWWFPIYGKIKSMFQSPPTRNLLQLLQCFRNSQPPMVKVQATRSPGHFGSRLRYHDDPSLEESTAILKVDFHGFSMSMDCKQQKKMMEKNHRKKRFGMVFWCFLAGLGYVSIPCTPCLDQSHNAADNCTTVHSCTFYKSSKL